MKVFAHEPEIRSLIDAKSEMQSSGWRMWKRSCLSKAHLSKLPGARGTSRFDVHVVYEKKIDVPAEIERLKKELEKFEKEAVNLHRQLGNEPFLAKAPSQVIENMRKRLTELEVLREKTRSKLEELGIVN